MIFIRLTRFNIGDDVLVNLGNVRTIYEDKGLLAQTGGGTTPSVIAFDSTTGEGHVLTVNESLAEIVQKIDEAERTPSEDLAERKAEYHARMAARKIRRQLEYRTKIN